MILPMTFQEESCQAAWLSFTDFTRLNMIGCFIDTCKCLDGEVNPLEITEAFLQSALESLKQDILSTLHVAMPGNIVSYDEATGTATVQPGLRQKTSSGAVLTAPVLTEVPVLRPSSDFTIAEGDPCILLFMDFCMDGWLESDQPVIPPVARKHDLSDAVALVGYFRR